MPTNTTLVLTHGPQTWPLDRRPIAIGRLPECDVVVSDDAHVSRHHAYIVPTPNGPLLVDRSLHGTSINGETMRAPWLLAEGDEIQIGSTILQVAQRQFLGEPAPQRKGGFFAVKLRHWLHRYGPSEVLGTVAAVGTAGAIQQATGTVVVAAYAGSLAETVVFYGIMFLRESMREAHQAGMQGRPYGSAELLPVARNLVLEFGVAEALDMLILRPFCMGLGLQLVGGAFGAFVGKIVSDIAFYGPVLTIYEWRLARTRAARTEDRRRRTTATALRQPLD